MDAGSGAHGPEFPPGVGDDLGCANVARVCDARLGGKNNFATDRLIAIRLAEVQPLAVAGVRSHRRVRAAGPGTHEPVVPTVVGIYPQPVPPSTVEGWGASADSEPTAPGAGGPGNAATAAAWRGWLLGADRRGNDTPVPDAVVTAARRVGWLPADDARPVGAGQ